MINSLSLTWLDNMFTAFKGTETSNKELINLPNTILSSNQNPIEANPCQLKNKTILEQLTVGVFFNHRDVKVVLDDLNQFGFPLSSLTLMARNPERHNWRSGLRIFSHFEEDIFSFSQECEQFFQRFFRRGKYILVVQGTEDMVHFASQVLSRRRDHSQVWRLVKNS